MTYELFGNEGIHYIEVFIGVFLFVAVLIPVIALARAKNIAQKLGAIALAIGLVGAGLLCISAGSNGAQGDREEAAEKISDYYGVNIDVDTIWSYSRFAYGDNGRPDDIYDFTAPSPGDATELKSYGLHYDQKTTMVRLYERTGNGYTELPAK